MDSDGRPGPLGILFLDYAPMSLCRGVHSICPCRQEVMDELVDSLGTMVRGMESLLAANPKLRQLVYKDFAIGLPSAKSVLRRARNLG